MVAGGHLELFSAKISNSNIHGYEILRRFWSIPAASASEQICLCLCGELRNMAHPAAMHYGAWEPDPRGLQDQFGLDRLAVSALLDLEA